MSLAGPEADHSIEELEGVVWPASTFGSYVVRMSLALRRKPLRDLTNEEVRLGVGQQIGLTYLVPLAIERLAPDPLAEAGLFEGDLLNNLLSVPRSFWAEHRPLADAVTRLWETAAARFPAMDDIWQKTIWPELAAEYARFSGTLPSRAWIRTDNGRTPPPMLE